MKIYLKKVAIAMPDGVPLQGVISVDHPDPDIRFGAQVDDWEDRADEETMKALK